MNNFNISSKLKIPVRVPNGLWEIFSGGKKSKLKMKKDNFQRLIVKKNFSKMILYPKIYFFSRTRQKQKKICLCCHKTDKFCSSGLASVLIMHENFKIHFL